MNKQEIYDFIKSKNIWYEITEHDAVFNMDEVANIELPYPQRDGKNLFVRDDKKRNYYLITVKGNKRVDLKKFSKENQIRRLSFASGSDLKEILNLIPGSVTPLGLLNDEEHKVIFYLDEDFFLDNQIIGVHPNENTATLWLKASDLVELIRVNGNPFHIVKINEQ
jgi:Ala-tRNA(Pro) deacylase